MTYLPVLSAESSTILHVNVLLFDALIGFNISYLPQQFHITYQG